MYFPEFLPHFFSHIPAAWNKNGILPGNETSNNSGGKNTGTGVSNASTAMNHLLLGKKPLTTKPRRPAHPGAIPAPKVKRPSVAKEESKKKVSGSGSATHYACPQPEVVPPSELKKHKKRHHHHRKRSPSMEFKKVGEETSSSTETGGNNGNGNDTDQGGSDIEELPNDIIIPEINVEQDDPEVSMTNYNLKQSRSSNDIFDSAVVDDKVEKKECKIRSSEPDLLKMNGHDDKKFLEELLEEFDKNSLSHEEMLLEPDQDPEDLDEKNEKALQIIKENSEILERLLNKKTTPCNPEQLEPLCTKPANNQVQHVQQQPKRRISHTSSNGSSNGSSSVTLQSNPATKPITFNPFPNSARANRKPKEVGRKLGLYK